MSADAIFKAYDVRGIYPTEINEDLCRAIGNAFARFTASSRIVVGHDMRPSSDPLSAAFIEGVTQAGVDVVHIGLASTDMLYFASGHLDAPGAMFTASHNPAQYNGIKFCRAGAAPIGEETGLRQIRSTVESGVIERGEEPGRVETMDLREAFADHVCSFIDIDQLRSLRVVADTANGMGGYVVPPVFARLPVALSVLFPELDGTFPNHPADPIQVENLKDLQRAVLDERADIGLAFDGDADRVFLVDDQAQPVSGAITTALVARGMLERNPGETIVHNLICSKVVPELVTELGGTPVRTRVGHSFIKQVMADTNAVFGGEHSGHYYFRNNYRADSGLIAALVVLQEVSRAGIPLSELRKPLERYAQSGEINSQVEDPAAVIERIAAHYSDAEQDRLDGLTCDLGSWWFNLRPSNTEPLLRLNLEAADREACDRRTAEVLALIRAAG
ncbi:MAG: phosphomannomutase/phosphoglucomutase [Acidimicrobiia bacterium]